MDGVESLPYRLHELIAADPSLPVFICEGEKDADRLASQGLVATTNSGGGGNWKVALNRWFAGRTCILLEDNDEKGRLHVEKVSAELAGIGKRTIVLRLPGLAEKGDVSDWLDAGHSIAELRQQAAQALSAKDADTGKPKAAYQKGISTAVLMAKQFAPVNYIISGLLAEGATLFGGKPNIGKSWMAYDFGLAVPLGRPVFGSIPVKQGDVLLPGAGRQRAAPEEPAAQEGRNGARTPHPGH
jgi:hypothetical protein